MRSKNVFCSRCRGILTFKGEAVSRGFAERLGKLQCNFRCPNCNSLICVPTGDPPMRWKYVSIKGGDVALYSSQRWRRRNKPPREFKLPYPEADV